MLPLRTAAGPPRSVLVRTIHPLLREQHRYLGARDAAHVRVEVDGPAYLFLDCIERIRKGIQTEETSVRVAMGGALLSMGKRNSFPNKKGALRRLFYYQFLIQG